MYRFSHIWHLFTHWGGQAKTKSLTVAVGGNEQLPSPGRLVCHLDFHPNWKTKMTQDLKPDQTIPGSEITRTPLSNRPSRVSVVWAAKGGGELGTRSPVGSRYTWHTPAKLSEEIRASAWIKPQPHPPGTPGKVACSFVLNAVTGQLHHNGNEQQEL